MGTINLVFLKNYLRMNLNQKKKKQFISLFDKRVNNNYFKNNRKIVLKSRWKFQQERNTFVRKSSYTQLTNICLLTNRSYAILNNFGLSRISLRKLASKNVLPGIYKASW